MKYLKDYWLPIAALLLIALVILLTGERGQAAAPPVVLVWTAPADTSEVNDRAVGYELKYNTVGPTGTDSLSIWNWYQSATRFTGTLPLPGTPGTADSVAVPNLSYNTTYYFALRAFDDGLPQADGVPRINYSGVSNVAIKATGQPPDLIAPSRITDLRAQ